ncbi:MAG: hypothetical protein K8R74_17250 [Bacteroidales bacterium]|nr:hypothetical protein [Bacteroidales bacterium]
MKNLLLLLLIVCVACNKDNEDEPLVISRIEYRIDSSIEGAMVKYINSNGTEEMDFLNDSTTWVYTFNWEKDLDSVGFKLKDYITWTSYRIIVNEDTVINYTGPVPEGGYAGWYPIYYKF